MPNLTINTTLNYSQNFDPKKRKLSQIKFIIFHYTGMKNENSAITKLTSAKSKVSSHYLIKNSGEILTLVPDIYTAWHAGISHWRNYKSLNKYSIGIEISNPGHQYKYKNFSKKQIKSLEKLTKFLIKKYNIKKNFILGHSDIAPDRKTDPGEKFPWKFLSKKKIGYWHDLNQSKLIKERNKKIDVNDKKIFMKNLFKIGYTKFFRIDNNSDLKLFIKSFQRRFRQELINGIIDSECLIISKKLVKKLK